MILEYIAVTGLWNMVREPRDMLRFWTPLNNEKPLCQVFRRWVFEVPFTIVYYAYRLAYTSHPWTEEGSTMTNVPGTDPIASILLCLHIMQFVSGQQEET